MSKMKTSFYCSYDPKNPNPDTSHKDDDQYNGGSCNDGW